MFYFIILFYPIECQIFDIHCIPLVLYLGTRTINDVSYFIIRDEFSILYYKKIVTYDAYSSPMNKPSFILIAPTIIF